MRHSARAAVLAASVALVASPLILRAQLPSLEWGYPVNDAPLTLSSGTVVHQRNLVVFRGNSGNSLTITIETPTPASAREQSAREAREVATLHDELASGAHADLIVVAVCRSRACVELKELPAERFEFRRASDGEWEQRTAIRVTTTFAVIGPQALDTAALSSDFFRALSEDRSVEILPPASFDRIVPGNQRLMPAFGILSLSVTGTRDTYVLRTYWIGVTSPQRTLMDSVRVTSPDSLEAVVSDLARRAARSLGREGRGRL